MAVKVVDAGVRVRPGRIVIAFLMDITSIPTNHVVRRSGSPCYLDVESDAFTKTASST